MLRLLTFDVVVVLGFVVLGRETHAEGNALADVATTAAPFLIALAIAWVATRIANKPIDARRGALVGAITVALGMVLRRFAFDDGTAAAFIAVAAVFNLGGMIGWRLVAGRLRTRRGLVNAG
jgi:ribose/xylose/arabinose/galactoside ABC-type transport system permease subunit